jgi:hypothetical protein
VAAVPVVVQQVEIVAQPGSAVEPPLHRQLRQDSAVEPLLHRQLRQDSAVHPLPHPPPRPVFPSLHLGMSVKIFPGDFRISHGQTNS